MIFVWSGLGIWIFAIPAIALGMAAGGIDYFAVPQPERIWWAAVAMGVAGVACVALGVKARLSAPQAVMERQTGRELMRRPVHSAYWIRAEYWGLLYAALGMWMFLSRNS